MGEVMDMIVTFMVGAVCGWTAAALMAAYLEIRRARKLTKAEIRMEQAKREHLREQMEKAFDGPDLQTEEHLRYPGSPEDDDCEEQKADDLEPSDQETGAHE